MSTEESATLANMNLLNGYVRRSYANHIPPAIIKICLLYYMVKEQWSSKHKGDRMVISGKYNDICTTNDNCCNRYVSIFTTEEIKSGQHHWKLKLLSKGKEMCCWENVIGIVRSNDNNIINHALNGCITDTFNTGYGLIGCSRSYGISLITEGYGACTMVYGEPVTKCGDIVDIYLDLNKKILSYMINGNDYGVAFSEIDNNVSYKMGITLTGKGASFQLLSYNLHDKLVVVINKLQSNYMSTHSFAIENGVILNIIFGSFLVITSIMFGFSLVTIYRCHSINLRKKVKKLNVVRYMTSFCIILQFVTFIGYYFDLSILYSLLWNIWIPCFTFSFALLSYNIANIYLDTVNMSTRRQYNKRQKSNNCKLSINNDHKFELITNTALNHDDDDDDDLYYDSTDDDIDIDKKDMTKTSSLRRGLSSMRQLSARSLYIVQKQISPIFWRFIWLFWILCSLSNWIGSILGWIFKLYLAQSFCYMLWKLITFIMLCFCQYILMIVRDRLSHCLSKNNKTLSKKGRMNRNLSSGQKRIKNLIFCELILSIFLLLSCIYEIYIISILIKNDDYNKNNNIYLHSSIISMIIYFPIWTSIHIILLIYPWINRIDIKPIKQKTNTWNLKKTDNNNNNKKETEINEKTEKNENTDNTDKNKEKITKLSHLPSIAETIHHSQSKENIIILDITDDDIITNQ